VNRNIFFNLLMLSLCMTFIPFTWAGDDAETAKMRSACDNEKNSAACFRMGERYRIVERDNKTALVFYKKSCEAGYMTGCTNGGNLLYMKGTQYSSQWKEAKKMYQKACDAGEDPSCFNLGSINYREGRQKKAIKFYKQACKMGNQSGCAKEQRLLR
jgi:uncharacterized protein